MKNELTRINSTALALFDRTLELAQKMEEEAEFRPAEWFDAPEKRLAWWHDLQPEWQRAFGEAAFFRKGKSASDKPSDAELVHLFEQKNLDLCGSGVFKRRNNPPDISFQLTNLTGVRNLTNLERLEVDYNGQIESLEPLGMLKNLRTLWCDNNRISDLAPIAGLPRLHSLCCWNNRIESLEPLRGMLELIVLTLGHQEQGNPIRSWEPLIECWALLVVHINGCPEADLEAVKKMPTGDRINWDTR